MNFKLKTRKTLLTSLVLAKGQSSDEYRFDFSGVGVVARADLPNAVAQYTIRETSVKGRVLFENVTMPLSGDALGVFTFHLTSSETSQLPLGHLKLSIDFGLPQEINREVVEAILTVVEPLPQNS